MCAWEAGYGAGAGLVSLSPPRPPAVSSESSVVWIMMKMMRMAVMKSILMGAAGGISNGFGGARDGSVGNDFGDGGND